MRLIDLFQYSRQSLGRDLLRTALILLATAMGVAAVILLTSLGEGARRYVIGEFSSLGTHLLIVLPGRSETTGGAPPLFGTTPRDLTLADAKALLRTSAIERIAPVTLGSAFVSWQQRDREITILGSTADFQPVRQLTLGLGRFLPPGDLERGHAVCVLGSKVKQELFGHQQALGQWVRIGERRFRVIGVLKAQGMSLGLDLADVAIIPVASAQALFNTNGLFRILVQANNRDSLKKAEQQVVEIIRARHDGEDDVTVIAQDSLLATFDRILLALTLTVAGIAAISLVVAGILIMNVMLISVSQRTAEIGLLKALGGSRQQILALFLTEAALLSLLGAMVGLLFAWIGHWVFQRLFPDFPLALPFWAPIAAISLALFAGIIFGLLPARQAARLDPVQALQRR